MRHRIAGNRINMPEPRRRAAIRSMIEGLILHEAIVTTEARAKAIKSEAERLIAMALRGRKEAYALVENTVGDKALVQQLWDLAGEANFSLHSAILSNEDRLLQNKVPLRPETRVAYEEKLADRKKRLLALVSDEKEASAVLEATRKARAMEVHTRRTIASHMPSQLVIRKLFDYGFQDRFIGRNGGYTRISKLGRRAGDGADMVKIQLVFND